MGPLVQQLDVHALGTPLRPWRERAIVTSMGSSSPVVSDYLKGGMTRQTSSLKLVTVKLFPKLKIDVNLITLISKIFL